MLFRLVLLLISSIGVSLASTEVLEERPVVSEIELTGLDRTAESVVYQELLFKEGETITVADYDESIQRLRNLRIFSTVEPEIKMEQNGTAKLSTHFEEKWTTVPIVKFSSGGNARYFIVGTYDINVFGKYKEVGGQYENYNGKHSAVLWYRNPRFLKKRLLFGVDGWTVNRPYTLYNDDASIDQAFVLNRKKLNSFIDWEYLPWLTLGVGIELDRDQLLGTQSDANIVRTSITFGRLNYNNYLLNGTWLKLDLEQSLATSQDTESFIRASLDGQYFYRLPLYGNLAIRLRGGQSNATALQHLFWVGGLENVRGYYDTQYRGTSFWQLNTEYRLPSYRSAAFVLQHTLFFDAAQVADDINEFTNSELHTSYGAGIRLISPKIYRLTFRLDYAITNSTTGASSISFGAQQFF